MEPDSLAFLVRLRYDISGYFVVRYDGSERTAHISARILTGGLPPI